MTSTCDSLATRITDYAERILLFSLAGGGSPSQAPDSEGEREEKGEVKEGDEAGDEWVCGLFALIYACHSEGGRCIGKKWLITTKWR